jgi:threonine dehydrogenase-like Zn-dependent dehydrogenase
MRASLTTADRGLQPGELAQPRPGPGQLLIRVRACGICGSDLHALASGHVAPGWALGHEFAGEVAELGEGVSAFAPGERVVSFSAMPCGVCAACESGATVQCASWRLIGLGQQHGGFAEYALSHASVVYKLPDGLAFDDAAACEPLMVAMYAVRSSGILPGETAAIFGAGPIGLFVLQYLRLTGVADVWVVEPNPVRRQLAARLGATAALDPTVGDASTAITAATVVGPHVVFDCAGARGTLQAAGLLARRGGRVQLVGVNMAEDELFALPWILREVEVRGSLGGREEFPLALRLLGEGKIDVAAMRTATIALDALGPAFADLMRSDTRHVFVVAHPDGAQTAPLEPSADVPSGALTGTN